MLCALQEFARAAFWDGTTQTGQQGHGEPSAATPRGHEPWERGERVSNTYAVARRGLEKRSLICCVFFLFFMKIQPQHI